jgi:cytochrome c-type biogenesis protein CcmH/NrfF
MSSKEYLSDYACPLNEIPDGCPVEICQYPKCVPCSNQRIKEMQSHQASHDMHKEITA